MNRASHSFFAAFVGWLIPFMGFLAWMQFDENGFGYITDFEFLLFWPLLFTFLGWLLVGLPAVVYLGKDPIPPLWKVAVVLTIATTLTFLAIAGTFQFGLIVLIWWPALIGLIGGSVYWVLQRLQPRHGWIFWVVPILFFPFVRFVALPFGIAFFPYMTHILAEGAIGREALIEVIRRVEVGDTYEDLHRRCPRIFDQPVLATSSSGDDWTYSIRFDESRERVVKIEVTSKTNSEQTVEATADLPGTAGCD